MAVDLRENIAGPTKGLGRLGRLLQTVILRTREEDLWPHDFVSIQLTPGQQASLAAAMRSNGKSGMAGVRSIVVNVEGYPIRYCDASTATSGYGELYPAGSSMFRSFHSAQSATFAADAGNGGTATVNVSLYGEPRE